MSGGRPRAVGQYHGVVATFTYIARDPAGQRVTGKLAGGSEQAVLAELQARQLWPVKVEEVRQRQALQRRISTRRLAQVYRQLSDLLRAGVPLLRALRLLGRSKSHARFASVMSEVADEVADGSRLADALGARPEVFPSIQVAMVNAGERGGFLEAVLARMGAFLENQADMQGKVVGNLIYPAVLLCVGAAIIVFALVFFVPRFQDFYAAIELPAATRVLLASSDALIRAWPAILLGLAALVAAGWWAMRRPQVCRAAAVAQLRVPAVGPFVRTLAVARFARILGTLLENGIPLLTAMQISRDAAGHVLLAEAIDRAAESVRAGEPLAQPLAESGLFGEDVVEMIAVGESANNLAVVLITIAETIEKRVERTLGILIRFIEPALLLALAGAVLFIFIALIVPMMRLSAAM
jgi:general secretion pathway protein F